MTDESDIATRIRAARTLGCKRWLARQEIQLRFDRGDYKHILQHMDEATKEAMSRALIREVMGEERE